MASHYYGAPHYLPNSSAHNHGHHGRSRRGPRISSQNAHRQYKAQRSPKEAPEAPPFVDYLQRFEAAKSFEFDDDEVFCPFHLLTEDDLQSIHSSSSSERGSLSSGSPEGSPLQQQIQPSFSYSGAPGSFHAAPSSYQQHASHQQMNLHQPIAQSQRTRNAIPIVDPSTRSIASPPLSVSPAGQMQQQYMTRRW
ncbi:hypothetical protein LTR91_013794 [Friedmanniomyces endolithicus]|uniref:Uncharacterized protein n=1 Tax=Friedmanniomyces endolithicus TaxID=329885 RepID=A0AAN6KCX5_9PEZI|nr:hypothetical protein LTR57_014543 [Friedmanniomyces endolithicus]KAK0976089.1 hypothetical protein LTR91_013794 [Friedmanniomyces endolithicus]KAK0979018.1 hypothetical protein LTS01_012540 [Friedmanniomyces endolithicus]KAK1033607.1 hypothetical protein LTS16_016165 [Friedmanniomyces endolithicus]KAK1044504.1 hypothetical protein LTR33_015301 [Friedmanniomyces endolithicus]